LNKSNSAATKGPDLASMAKAKSSAGIWGAPAANQSAGHSQPLAYTPNVANAGQSGSGSASLGNGLDDLLG